MTEIAERFMIDILSPQMTPIPVVRQVADAQITRPIVIVAGTLEETYIPNGRHSVAKIGLNVKLETQVGQHSDSDHINLISQLSAALPNYGQWTGSQNYYQKVFFGPIISQQETVNDLVRSYVFGLYLVGDLTTASQ